MSEGELSTRGTEHNNHGPEPIEDSKGTETIKKPLEAFNQKRGLIHFVFLSNKSIYCVDRR